MANSTAWKLLWLITGAAIGYLAIEQWPHGVPVEQGPEKITPRTSLPNVRRFPQTSQSGGTITGIASVIDGDTIEIHGQLIRLWGIDAPEGNQLCRANGKPWRCGQQAALSLSNKIRRHTVTCEARDRDQYERVIAVCGIRHTPDLSHWLVRQGWALDWPRYSRRAYSPAQGEAKGTRKGMWRGEFEKPWEWRQAH